MWDANVLNYHSFCRDHAEPHFNSVFLVVCIPPSDSHGRRKEALKAWLQKKRVLPTLYPSCNEKLGSREGLLLADIVIGKVALTGHSALWSPPQLNINSQLPMLFEEVTETIVLS